VERVVVVMVVIVVGVVIVVMVVMVVGVAACGLQLAACSSFKLFCLARRARLFSFDKKVSKKSCQK
jgi:hypothetical protein